MAIAGFCIKHNEHILKISYNSSSVTAMICPFTSFIVIRTTYMLLIMYEIDTVLTQYFENNTDQYNRWIHIAGKDFLCKTTMHLFQSCLTVQPQYLIFAMLTHIILIVIGWNNIGHCNSCSQNSLWLGL